VILTGFLPAVGDPDSLFDAFSAWVEGRGLETYPRQLAAVVGRRVEASCGNSYGRAGWTAAPQPGREREDGALPVVSAASAPSERGLIVHGFA
jgi:hypothetical protein